MLINLKTRYFCETGNLTTENEILVLRRQCIHSLNDTVKAVHLFRDS